MDIEATGDTVVETVTQHDDRKRKKEEAERRDAFLSNVDTLYQRAAYSRNPKAYSGADIWKYFYEDLKVDYVTDSLTQNFLFLFTDGYPIVGHDLAKLQTVPEAYPNLKLVLMEAAPRDRDMEWDRVIALWEEWFDSMKIKDYQFVKRMALSKEKDLLREILKGS